MRALRLALLLASASASGCVGGPHEFNHDCSGECEALHMRLVRVELRRLTSGSGIICVCEPEAQP